MSKYIYDNDTKEVKELVQCKNCKYYRTYKYNCWDVCELLDKTMLEDDYCSKGIKKKQGDFEE